MANGCKYYPTEDTTRVPCRYLTGDVRDEAADVPELGQLARQALATIGLGIAVGAILGAAICRLLSLWG